MTRWRAVFRDPATIKALNDAAESCMRQVCTSHKFAECTCRTNMMTPYEFASWLELEILKSDKRSFPAGIPGRRRPNAVSRSRAVA